MPDLRINFDGRTENQVLFSGTTVSGNLQVSIDEPKSYKRVVIHFTGRSHVHWTEKHRERRHDDSHGNDRDRDRVVTRSYTSNETFADLEAVLWDSQQSGGKLDVGQYSWPFSFTLPSMIPSSFEGRHGHIRYFLHGKIVTGLLKFNHNVEIPVPVQQLVKITDPRLLQPARKEVQKTVCCLCCASGPIVLTVAVPKTGFILGESFQLQVSLENGSSRQLTISACIVENVTFYAQGHHSHSGKPIVSVSSEEINTGTTEDWNPTIQIPTFEVAIIHESSCRNIRVVYSLNVTCQIPGAIDLSTSFPLALGNCQDQQSSGLAAAAVAAFPPSFQQPGGPPSVTGYPPPAGPGWNVGPGSSTGPPTANEKTPLIKK